jgi:hypothetical protein
LIAEHRGAISRLLKGARRVIRHRGRLPLPEDLRSKGLEMNGSQHADEGGHGVPKSQFYEPCVDGEDVLGESMRVWGCLLPKAKQVREWIQRLHTVSASEDGNQPVAAHYLRWRCAYKFL